MARRSPVSPEVRAWPVRRVARGERVADVARELGVSLRAIYNWRMRDEYRKYAYVPDRSGKDYGPRDLSGTRQAKILAKLRAALPEICRAAAERHRNDED